MRQLKAKFKRRESELTIIIERVLEKMENNPDFPNPPTALANLKTVLPELRVALVNAEGRDKQMVSIKNDKKLIARTYLLELAEYVTGITKGDRTLILSSGFDVTSESNYADFPASIERLEVELGQPGEATTYAKGISGVKGYVHQYCKEPPGQYTEWFGEGSSKSNHTFRGLASDKRYWFRVMAIGFNRERAFSPVVSRVIQ